MIKILQIRSKVRVLPVSINLQFQVNTKAFAKLIFSLNNSINKLQIINHLSFEFYLVLFSLAINSFDLLLLLMNMLCDVSSNGVRGDFQLQHWFVLLAFLILRSSEVDGELSIFQSNVSSDRHGGMQGRFNSSSKVLFCEGAESSNASLLHVVEDWLGLDFNSLVSSCDNGSVG